VEIDVTLSRRSCRLRRLRESIDAGSGRADLLSHQLTLSSSDGTHGSLASWTEARRIAIGVLLAAATVVAGGVSGMDHQIYSALVIMGFDPDRALLIRALLVGAGAASGIGVGERQSRVATLLGLLSFAALFGPTFAAELGRQPARWARQARSI